MASDPHYHRRLSYFRFRRFDGCEASFCGTTSSCSGRPHRRPRSGCQPPSCKWQLALRPRRYSVASSHWDHRLLENLDENIDTFWRIFWHLGQFFVKPELACYCDISVKFHIQCCLLQSLKNLSWKQIKSNYHFNNLWIRKKAVFKNYFSNVNFSYSASCA